MKQFEGTNENWNFKNPTSKFDACTISESGKIIGYTSKNSKEDIANEKLRAAALDMFKSLKAIVENIDNWLESGEPADAELSKKLYTDAKKSLDKAFYGETNEKTFHN